MPMGKLSRRWLLAMVLAVLSSGCVAQQADEVAHLRGEVEQALHSLASLRSELEDVRNIGHSIQTQSLSQDQDLSLATSALTEKFQQQHIVPENQRPSETTYSASLKEFKQVLDSLRVQTDQQASFIRQLETRLEEVLQTVRTNASQATTYLSDVQSGVASLALSVKDAHQAFRASLDQQEQRMSQLSGQAQSLSVRNVEGAASSGELQQLVSTVAPLRETVSLVAQQLGERVDAHEEELSDHGRGQGGMLPKTMDRIQSTAPIVLFPDRSVALPAGHGATTTQLVSPLEEKFYQSAFHLLQIKQNDRALEKFSEFLRQYPTSPLAPNAQYWKGECYYSSQQYEDAIREFSLVLQHYPADEKAPAALLKIGYSQFSMKNHESARTSFHQVVRRFPQSSEAIKAYSRLIDVARIADRTS